jgi:hypothetical protein
MSLLQIDYVFSGFSGIFIAHCVARIGAQKSVGARVGNTKNAAALLVPDATQRNLSQAFFAKLIFCAGRKNNTNSLDGGVCFEF